MRLQGPRAAPEMLALILCLATCACLGIAWGPGHHLEYSQRIHRRRKEWLPRATAKLIEEERDAFEYGSIAADIINFKGYGGAYSHCHRWTIVADMRELAATPREESFVCGYLAHLAADTIAHNHFVPYHLARYARTQGLGPRYWEMNADRHIPHERWSTITRLKENEALTELDELVNRTVPRKALSMGTNKLIFNHVLLVSERDRWRRGMEQIHPIGNVRLQKGFLGLFQRAAVERVRLALQRDGLEAISIVDANGKEAQRKAMAARRGLLARFLPSSIKHEESEALALPFLSGMESPPPRAR
jgi:hypothetical protein